MTAAVKGVLVAFVQSAWDGDRNLAKTYQAMGWTEFRKTPHPTSDPFELLGEFVGNLCLDEDGYFNAFLHPIARVIPPVLKHFGHTLSLGRLPEIGEMMTSGEANAKGIAALLREICGVK